MAASPARSLLAAAAAIVAFGALLAPAGIAHAADGDADWAVRTASNDQGSERTGFSYTLQPGSSVQDALVVVNHGATALDLGVYAADGYTTESGQFDVLVGGDTSTSVGAWARPSSSTVHVEPGASVEVPFTLTVPDNATPGDHAGAIVTSLVQPDTAQGINVDRRLGIKISLRVGGDLKPSLAVEKLHVDYDGGWLPFVPGTATLGYTLHNTGNAIISAQQAASVAGPFGLFPTDASDVKTPPQLLPGESWTVSIPVSAVPPLFLLTATASVTPAVVDASGSTTNLTPVTRTVTGWAVPWTLLIAVVLVVILILVARALGRRRRIRQKEREDARVQAAVQKALAGAS